jgi:hypothetical protein
MNAMLEARMVAASTQRPRDFEHGAAAGRERITFSSQGSWKIAHILAAYHRQKIVNFSNQKAGSQSIIRNGVGNNRLCFARCGR